MSGDDPREPSPPLGPRSPRRGAIDIVCGSMFSGKTEELLRRLKRARYARLSVAVFKPQVDQRYDAVKIVSHAGDAVEAQPVGSSAELWRKLADAPQLPALVGIDEVQFFDAGVVEVCQRLADAGVRVICAGLDQDYLGQPFGPVPQLMAVAETVTKLRAVCSQCGADASRSQRLVAREGQLFVGGAASYEARCRACHVKGDGESFPPEAE